MSRRRAEINSTITLNHQQIDAYLIKLLSFAVFISICIQSITIKQFNEEAVTQTLSFRIFM